MFDVDRDGVLSRDELHEMVVALLEVWKDNRTDTLPVSLEPGGSTTSILWSLKYQVFCFNTHNLHGGSSQVISFQSLFSFST